MTTIIQLTDTHVTANGRLAYGEVDTSAALAKALAHINALPAEIGPIDAVFVTGDLRDLGTPAEYAAFRALTEDLATPLYVLPGNHDDRADLRAAFGGDGYLPAGDGPLDYAVTIGRLTVIALDSTVPGQPYGKLESDQLAWLADVLAVNASTPTVVLLHHPPSETQIRHMDRQNLRNGADLLTLLSDQPQVRLLACGHVHRAISTMIGRVPCMIAPAPAHSMTLDMNPNADPTFTLEPGAVTVHQSDSTPRPSALISYLSYIGQFKGPYPFFGEDAAINSD